MRRREFITLLGSAVAWPLAARAQQAAMPVVGFLASGSRSTMVANLTGFLAGLKEAGFVDGRNATIEYQWAEGRYDRLPKLAAELVRHPANVIATVGGEVAARAAKRATSTIPIVFVAADDPVVTGLVASLDRPGGNVTGVTWLGTQMAAKNLEMLHELLPAVSVIGLLVNPERPTADAQVRYGRNAAIALGKTLRVLNASTASEIDAAFATVAREEIGALIVPPDPVFSIHGNQIIALAARHRVPTTYFLPGQVAAGGLMSYGSSLFDASRLMGLYAGRILKGEKPADLPVQQSTKIELIINLKTAKTLGLTIPVTLLGRADKVIE
jgi:putative ABC transport system substrate-binding protein